MGDAGHPHGRFQRALQSGNVLLACAAAAELGQLQLPDAFSLLWLLRNDARFPRAAARFTGRALVETPTMTIEEAQLLAAALQLLPGLAAKAGLHAVADLAARHQLSSLEQAATRILQRQ